MDPKLPTTFAACAAACLAAALAGCGGPAAYDAIPTHPASGQVTVNGVPAKGAIVRLYPKSPQPGAKYPLMPSGKTDEAGVFHLTTYEDADGAPAGAYTLTLEWPDPAWRPPGGGMPPPPPDRLQGRFSDPEQSQFEVRIVEGENDIQPIVLEDVPILEGSSLSE
ncbi:transthyretin-like family protein [Candidatus Laterigemmans baculatus]|uniref:carboxypeptidase regulatory-like domain-containing protein n=1 Tax=Candidatus Laterigemmans baculatus TaxID=2770505 RepID=UPI0013D9A655|nr:carboxypeptidase regulatory-like domain-containing protein [Candidatus Laterigemmans baculatus]